MTCCRGNSREGSLAYITSCTRTHLTHAHILLRYILLPVHAHLPVHHAMIHKSGLSSCSCRTVLRNPHELFETDTGEQMRWGEWREGMIIDGQP